MADTLFIPTEIPWKDLKDKELEELLYWLFDSMGAKELEWRIGSAGSGASDQGRDLELSFYVPSPDGNLVKQRWWVEAKGRKGTVEKSAVQEAVYNAANQTDLDVVVIATNAAFSNPTRDWLKEWQSTHPRPLVKLWEKTELENYCSKNPLAVIRLFSKALTPQGKLEVVKSRFWDYATFTDESTLSELWKKRAGLEFDVSTFLAIVASEIANGKIQSRSWAVLFDDDFLIEALSNGLINFLYLIFRADEKGTNQKPIIRSLAYLILMCTHRIGADGTSILLTKVWETVKDREYPQEIRGIILQPILNILNDEVQDVCANDCPRVCTDRIILTEDEVKTYWQRLALTEDEPEKDDRTLTIESYKYICKVGFDLDEDHGCPFLYNEEPQENIAETLRAISAVIKYSEKAP